MIQTKKKITLGTKKGYKTSISIEPVLERTHLFSLVRILDPYVTESIWIGTMNYISTKIPNEDWPFYKEVRATRIPKFLLEIYYLFEHNKKIRWKDSIKNILEKDAKKKNDKIIPDLSEICDSLIGNTLYDEEED